MSTRYVVKPGDTLSKIALAYHLPSYKNIYDDPENKKFKARRPNPNLIFPGDVLMIPSKPALSDPVTKTTFSPSITRALNLTYSFAKKQRTVENTRGCFVTTGGEFTQLHRATIAAELADRVMDPTKINQGKVDVCVPAALVYEIAKTQPEDYVKAVTELFDNGQTTLGKWKLTPNEDLKRYALPKDANIAEADWIIIASVRDSENWFFDYSSVKDKGGTTNREYKDMLSKAGFTDIQDDNSDSTHEDADNLKKADELYSKNYQVALRIDAAALGASPTSDDARSCHPPTNSPSSGKSNHRVVLASNIRARFSDLSAPVSMDVFTWGGKGPLPRGPGGAPVVMTLGKFLTYYFGYTAAKY
jgi:hypothetical protein